MKPTGFGDLHAEGYEALFREFDSPLMRRFRADAYGEDIGQHSWVGAAELRGDIDRLGLCPSKRLLDLGCGPCGPLVFILASVRCRGTGLELSTAAVESGRARAKSAGVSGLVSILEADLDTPLPFERGSFDAAVSLDIVYHVHDRANLFREVARVLSPGGRFLFTDPTVVTGCISPDDASRRSVHGYTAFAAPGSNEALLESAGFRLIETEDRTLGVLTNASGRLAALRAHGPELERALGTERVRRHDRYLEVVIDLARRGSVSRVMYLAEPGPSLNERCGGEP